MLHNGRSVYVPRMAEIIEATQVTAREKFFKVNLKDGMPLGHKPGQFVQVSVFGVGEAPISVSSSPTKQDGTFEMCIRKAGSLTSALHALPMGATIGIRGPYGRGFPTEDFTGYDLLFIAGGLGLVPLRSMINYALDNREHFGKLTLLYGARTPSDMLFSDEVARWRNTRDFDIETTVDLAYGNWDGHVGVITKLMEYAKFDPARTVALIVGPPVMFKFVIKSVLTSRISESRIYLSLERRMKCGVGKCGHCQIDNIYVCQKGPVFPYTKVRNLKEAF